MLKPKYTGVVKIKSVRVGNILLKCNSGTDRSPQTFKSGGPTRYILDTCNFTCNFKTIFTHTVHVRRFQTISFLFSTKMLIINAETHKMLVRTASRETLIRLLIQKQSDLGLHCLPMSFGRETSV